jgi:hypothetical protein
MPCSPILIARQSTPPTRTKGDSREGGRVKKGLYRIGK